MATSPRTSTPSKPINRRWLWAVRVAAVLGPSILWVGYFQPVSAGCPEFRPEPDFIGLAFVILSTLAYFYILFWLAGPSYKLGLAIAMTTGIIVLLISFLVWLAGDDVSATRYAAGFMLSQAALVTTAGVTYHLMGREADDTRTLWRGLVRSVICLALFLLSVNVFGSLFQPHRFNSESSAIGSLRTINTSEVTYSSTYTEGFSTTLAALGGAATAIATSSTAGLIDDMLAGGEKNRYTFTYVPGARDTDGKIETYTISARPILDCQGHLPSYFTNQTGVIRMTKENRPATAKDPPLSG